MDGTEKFKKKIENSGADTIMSAVNEYLMWCEENNKSEIVCALEYCLLHTKKFEKGLTDDADYMNLWCKYAIHFSDSDFIYRKLYNKHFFRRLSQFYILWATQLSNKNMINEAKTVFSKGVANNCEPKDLLEDAIKDFKAKNKQNMETVEKRQINIMFYYGDDRDRKLYHEISYEEIKAVNFCLNRLSNNKSENNYIHDVNTIPVWLSLFQDHNDKNDTMEVTVGLNPDYSDVYSFEKSPKVSDLEELDLKDIKSLESDADCALSEDVQASKYSVGSTKIANCAESFVNDCFNQPLADNRIAFPVLEKPYIEYNRSEMAHSKFSIFVDNKTFTGNCDETTLNTNTASPKNKMVHVENNREKKILEEKYDAHRPELSGPHENKNENLGNFNQPRSNCFVASSSKNSNHSENNNFLKQNKNYDIQKHQYLHTNNQIFGQQYNTFTQPQPPIYSANYISSNQNSRPLLSRQFQTGSQQQCFSNQQQVASSQQTQFYNQQRMLSPQQLRFHNQQPGIHPQMHVISNRNPMMSPQQQMILAQQRSFSNQNQMTSPHQRMLVSPRQPQVIGFPRNGNFGNVHRPPLFMQPNTNGGLNNAGHYNSNKEVIFNTAGGHTGYGTNVIPQGFSDNLSCQNTINPTGPGNINIKMGNSSATNVSSGGGIPKPYLNNIQGPHDFDPTNQDGAVPINRNDKNSVLATSQSRFNTIENKMGVNAVNFDAMESRKRLNGDTKTTAENFNGNRQPDATNITFSSVVNAHLSSTPFVVRTVTSSEESFPLTVHTTVKPSVVAATTATISEPVETDGGLIVASVSEPLNEKRSDNRRPSNEVIELLKKVPDLKHKIVKPFEKQFVSQLTLALISFIGKLEGFLHIEKFDFNFIPGTSFAFFNNRWQIMSCIGNGGFADVYLVKNLNESTVLNCWKVQSSLHHGLWEYFVGKEITRRLSLSSNGYESLFLNPINFIVTSVKSVMVYTYYKAKNLLDVSNIMKNSINPISEVVVLMLARNIFHILSVLHGVNFLHGDIKPDNLLLLEEKDATEMKLKLIDFGKCIDLGMLSEDNVMLFGNSNTDKFECIEMKEKKPWKYSTDIYGAVATVYVLMFHEYMEPVKLNGKYKITHNIKRSWDKKFWNQFFDDCLNMKTPFTHQTCASLRDKFDEKLFQVDQTLVYKECIQFLHYVNRQK